MPHTSPFFSNTTGYSAEVALLDDLVREQIRIYGVDVLYMPRKMLNLDKLLHESSKNAFELALPVPAYVKTFDGYDNGLEVLSKFGVRSSDELTLHISRSEFITHYSPFLKAYYNANALRPGDADLERLDGETDARPKEGDLIYFPFDDGIFEIKYVQFDVPFFQLGKNYIFELQCERFEFSGDTFDTGYEEVDDTAKEPDFYRLQFDMNTSTGKGSFVFNEKVIIYNLGEYEVIDGGSSIINHFDTIGGSGADIIGLSPPYPIADGGGAAPARYNLPLLFGGFANTTHSLDTISPGGSETINIKIYDAGTSSDIEYLQPLDDFRLYKDPGYVTKVEKVEGTVMVWEKPNGLLTVSDLTNLDPEQTDFYRDLVINKFDKVVIQGQESGAIWYSEKAFTQDKAFDDGTLIQQEFDAIKIIDEPGDVNPFGFV